MENVKRNAILAVILAVVAFFWIWLFDWLGAKAYWAALVAFGVCMAYGPALARALPWMTLGSVLGVLAGLLSFVLYMLVFPLYYGLSVAIAGAIFILIAGLVSIPKMREMLPMYLVGWGVFLGAMSRFDYLLMEKPVEAIPRAMSTLFGTILSLLFGMLLAAVLDAVLISPRRKRAAEAPGSAGE
ncbi:MAG: hypothetical protein ACUVRX_02320 [Actinomycetota bacterium]